MRYGYLIAGLLVLILVADIGWKAWSERPYIVTGYGVAEGGSKGVYTVEFRVPGGGTGEWRVPVQTEPGGYGCWRLVRIGTTIPDCLRSWNEIDNGR